MPVNGFGYSGYLILLWDKRYNSRELFKAKETTKKFLDCSRSFQLPDRDVEHVELLSHFFMSDCIRIGFLCLVVEVHIWTWFCTSPWLG